VRDSEEWSLEEGKVLVQRGARYRRAQQVCNPSPRKRHDMCAGSQRRPTLGDREVVGPLYRRKGGATEVPESVETWDQLFDPIEQ